MNQEKQQELVSHHQKSMTLIRRLLARVGQETSNKTHQELLAMFEETVDHWESLQYRSMIFNSSQDYQEFRDYCRAVLPPEQLRLIAGL